MKKIGVIYTVKPVLETLPSDIYGELGEVELHHILDEELLGWMKKDEGMTLRQLDRMREHIRTFESEGVNCIISSCSSLGDMWDKLEGELKVPILKIDAAMMELAVETGENITLIATAPTTVTPSIHHLEKIAKQKGKSIKLTTLLMEDAGKALFNNDKDTFVKLLIEEAKKVENQDVIVLAQASMDIAKQNMAYQLNLPVLSSPNPFIINLKKNLGGVLNGNYKNKGR